MMNRLLTLALLSAAAALPLLSTAAANAQSMPAGQVSNRSAVSTADGRPKAGFNQNLAGKLAAVAASGSNPGGIVPMERISGELSLNETPQAATCSGSEVEDANNRNNAFGSARKVVWDQVVAMDGEVPVRPPETLCAVRVLAGEIYDYTDVKTAQQTAQSALKTAATVLGTDTPQGKSVSAAINQIIGVLDAIKCSATAGSTTATSAKPQFVYNYRTFLPTMGTTCDTGAIQNFFSVNKQTVAGNNVQYLYNAQESASQLTGDLLTSTFAGFQAVLSSTVTAGSSQPASSTSSGSSSTTDSVATAVSKIQAGGDFNVKFPVPLMYYSRGNFNLSGLTSPNIGFNISGFGSQNTITEATEYSFNAPLELYSQFFSIDKDANNKPTAVLFLDVKPAGEFISSALAKSLGPSVPKSFFLGQASVGIEFAQSIRISFQYIYGNPKIYQSASTTTTSTASTMPATTTMNGFHLAVSFSPQKSKSSSN